MPHAPSFPTRRIEYQKVTHYVWASFKSLFRYTQMGGFQILARNVLIVSLKQEIPKAFEFRKKYFQRDEERCNRARVIHIRSSSYFCRRSTGRISFFFR